MPAATKFYQFVENLGKGVHNFNSDASCTLKLALTNTAPSPSNSVLADITQISYTNVSGTRVVANVGWEQTLGVAAFAGDDVTITATGTVPTFQYVVLYDDDPTSPADPLICYWNIGTPVNLTTGQNYLFDIVSGLGQLT